jgi:hypothetical protein
MPDYFNPFSGDVMKFHVNKTFYPLGAGILLMALFASCAFPFQQTGTVQLTDISGQLNYQEVSRRAFMGGSVLYNPVQPSSGQLAQGVNLGIRLGKVDRVDNGDPQPGFNDREDDAVYGYITVDSIDKQYISFTYTVLSREGKIERKTSHSLKLNERVDINGDGFDDLVYIKPLKKRPGMEESVYLTFLSSQETLTTTMFAVLPEQYSRGVYPSGIIGINPDGRFIISKYEGTTGTRSAVQGIVYGDYVLDSQLGGYQKVTGTGLYRNARNVDEPDLENIAELVPTGSYFLKNEFDENITPFSLINALPDVIKSRHPVDKDNVDHALQSLNQILEQYDLIEAVAGEKQIDVTDEELAEIARSIRTVELNTLVLVNRMFLTDVYPEYCPEVQKSSDDVAYILPLLSCIIGGDENPPVDEDSASRAVATSYSAYAGQRNNLQNKFSNYFKLPNMPAINLSNNPLATTSNLQLGLYGKVDNNWGSSIRFSVSAVVFLQIESTQVNLTKSMKGSLFPYKRLADLNIANITIGPVLIRTKCPIDFGIDYEIAGNAQLMPNAFIGFTGLYGAGAYVGANYGINWKKVLFVSIPWGFYFSPYIGGEVISDFAFFAGSVNTLPSSIAVSQASGYATITPRITAGPDVSLWGVIHGKVGIEGGLEGKMAITLLPDAAQLIKNKKNPTQATGTLRAFSNFFVSGYVGIDETILGIRINFGKEFGRTNIGILNKELIKYQIW